MSRPYWRASLKKALRLSTATEAGLRLAVLGIGNEVWGDDAAGCRAARLVQRRLSLNSPERFLIIDAGPAPENFSGVLRKFRPDFVLLIDAVRPGGSPAGVRWIEMADIEGVSALTHGLPLTVMAQFLTVELGAACGLLGIEGEQFEMGAGLSPAASRSVRLVAGEIRKLIHDLDRNIGH
jgi:hydrogenase 3 maturation protease